MKCSTCGLDAEANLCPDICHAEYVSTELILLSKELLEQNREIGKLTTERDALMSAVETLVSMTKRKDKVIAALQIQCDRGEEAKP